MKISLRNSWAYLIQILLFPLLALMAMLTWLLDQTALKLYSAMKWLGWFRKKIAPFEHEINPKFEDI